MDRDPRSLNIEQRAFIVGDEGVCPLCGREVDWGDIDSRWYCCVQCINEWHDPRDDINHEVRVLAQRTEDDDERSDNDGAHDELADHEPG